MLTQHEDPNRSSFGEDLWSRGSFSEPNDPPPSRPLYISLYEKSKEKPKLYRYEEGGIIIYISNARIAGDPKSAEPPQDLQTSSPTSPIKKILTTVEHRGNLNSDKKAFLEMKKLPPVPEYLPEFTIEIPKDTLRFYSNFESGNLYKAIMMTESLYVLYLEREAIGVCLQWYYFEVRNRHTGPVTFKIANLGKFESLYNEGMRPLIKSARSGVWERGGSNISYTENKEESSYTLTFTYNFAYESDSVLFAYSYPYTYSDLTNDLQHIRSNFQSIARVDSICQSLCGNDLYMITITEDIGSYLKFNEENYYARISAAQRKLLRCRKRKNGKDNEHTFKKGVFLSSRVHPGETVSSFIMQGVIDFLLSPCKRAQTLRKNFVFKLIPMLNPDGVRYGKTRVSMLGVDLNRRWDNPQPLLHPTIYYTKKFLQVFTEMHECVVFCDFHGHSTKRNAFFYGCNMKPLEIDQHKKNIMARMMPFMLSRRNRLISYKDSRFRMQKSKENTARIVVYKQFGIVSSLTLEASFYGPKSSESFRDNRTDLHMLPSDLRGIGMDFCQALHGYSSPSLYIKSLQILSNGIREASGLKPKACDSKEPPSSSRVLNYSLEQQIIDNNIWETVSDITYQSESSEESSASDIEEFDKGYPEGIKQKKIEIIRKPYRMVTPPRAIVRRQAKTAKTEKSEITKSPEAYFKMPGISVFSFNLRAKSSENIFNGAGKKEKEVDRVKTAEKEGRANKLIICNKELVTMKAEKIEAGKPRPGTPSIDQLYRSWIKSKSSLILKNQEGKKAESTMPTLYGNRAMIHIAIQKSPEKTNIYN